MMQKRFRISEDFHALIQNLLKRQRERSIERMSDSAAMPPEPPENVPQATHEAPGIQANRSEHKPSGQKGKRKPNAMVRVARTVHAMQALADGSAANKREAAALHGIGVQSLAPSRIAEALKSTHASGLLSIDPLDITADHEGERVSLRDTLAKGMESAIATLAKLQPLVGKMDKAQREAFRQAKDWMTLCRENGLWKTPINMPSVPGLPIAPAEANEEDIPGSGPWYLRHMNRHQMPEGETEMGGLAPIQAAKA